MATHSSIFTWKVLWTGEPGGLQFVGLHRVRHCWGQCEESKRDSILKPIIHLKDRMSMGPEPCPRVRKPLLVKTRSPGDFPPYRWQTEIVDEVRLPLLD